MRTHQPHRAQSLGVGNGCLGLQSRRKRRAGAHVLDVNAGSPLINEPEVQAQAIQLVQSVTDVPISVDSSVVAAL